ncbi:MAG: nitroreductase [Dehalococcoidia bacterium]|nr:nitroreductase [Dehalococcoidia bacterium]
MDLIEAINSRKSIRGYKPDPVPKKVLSEILEIASRSPSSMNTQPWEFTVIAGDVMEKIKQINVEKFNSGESSPGQGITRGRYTGEYRERQVAVAVQLFQLMGIAREDKEKRAEWLMRGLRFFDAPAAIIISADESLGPAAEYDIGAITQTIALVALTYGLGTCIQDQGLRYIDALRKLTGIPESKRLSICITIGYPDWDFPANKVRSQREPISKLVHWCGL